MHYFSRAFPAPLLAAGLCDTNYSNVSMISQTGPQNTDPFISTLSLDHCLSNS